MDTGESIGMMAGAYFVGRQQLLRWINDLTGLNYTKIEQTASGILACQVFDALFPGSIRLERVKFDARQQYEFVHNYKVLQAAFNRNGMKKQIDVERLIKGKYQDNLEFMQWIKAFYDSHASEDALNYDGLARREGIVGKTGRRPALANNRPRVNEARPTAARKTARPGRPGIRAPMGKPAQPTVSKAEHEELKEEFKNLETSLADSETEKNFYFDKLRNVEVIIQGAQDDVSEDKATLQSLKDVFEEIRETLYAEDDGAQEAGEPAEEYVGELGAEAYADEGEAI